MVSSPWRSVMVHSLLAALFSLILCCSSMAELTRFFHPPKSDGSLSFLAIGDWGRNGTFNQSLVAYQMGVIGEELDIDFIISVGDNFYESGLRDVDDKSFEESFTKIYTSKSLQKQWYSVLGNHDYRGNAMAQLDPILGKIDSRWLCMRSFIVDAEIANFFFLDTTPFVKKYWKNPKKNQYDWREVAPRKKYISSLLKTVVLRVAMSCQGCVGAVNRVLSKLEGVDSFEIELEKQKVTVKGNVKPDAVLQTVSKTGKKTAFWEEEAKEPSPAAANASATD